MLKEHRLQSNWKFRTRFVDVGRMQGRTHVRELVRYSVGYSSAPLLLVQIPMQLRIPFLLRHGHLQAMRHWYRVTHAVVQTVHTRYNSLHSAREPAMRRSDNQVRCWRDSARADQCQLQCALAGTRARSRISRCVCSPRVRSCHD